MPDDDDDAPRRMMRTGPHAEVDWDTARRLGLAEWAPETQVFAQVDAGRREKRAAAAAEPAKADPSHGAPIIVPAAKRRGRLPRQPQAAIPETERAGPGPRRRAQGV